MKIIYCDKWSNTRRKPWNIIDTSQAHKNHINKTPYTVLIQENDKIKVIVEFTKFYVSVNFLNEFLNSYLRYTFHLIDNDFLFLKVAYYYYYDEENHDMLEGTVFSFSENGYVTMVKRDYKTGEIEERELQNDVSANWEEYPGFGKYENLLKVER
ncbi:MAG: hypothetical protein FWC91_05375 [Defluviitaleaceae bacterium]|nr:hypothetical protein [Defluviitaleaceae bacterium]